MNMIFLTWPQQKSFSGLCAGHWWIFDKDAILVFGCLFASNDTGLRSNSDSDLY